MHCASGGLYAGDGMERSVITSVHNERVKRWAELLTRKGRERQRKFLLEGVHLVEEALKAGANVEAVLYSREKGIPAELARYAAGAVSAADSASGSESDRPSHANGSLRRDMQPHVNGRASWLNKPFQANDSTRLGKPLQANDSSRPGRRSHADRSPGPDYVSAAATCAAPSVEWIAVSEAVLERCSDAQTPQGVIAVAGKPPAEAASFLLAEPGALVVAVDGVQDPGNLGAIIRSADAAGATGVVLGRGTVDLYNPKTLRATMGSLFHLPVVEGDLPQLLPQLMPDRAQIIAASPYGEESCYDVDFTRPTWLVVGSEGSGISPAVGALARNVRIPMPGRAESLNVAMAATVLLFEAVRQRCFSQK